MYKLRYLLIFILFVALGSSIALALSAPREFAINTETQQCAGFWEGDQYRRYSLPDGWVSYPEETFREKNGTISNTVLVTPQGKCNLSQLNEQQCCSLFGYTYISPNIGDKKFYPAGSWRWLLLTNPFSAFLWAMALAFGSFSVIVYILKKHKY
jgi:hypothetical protein